MKILHVLTRPRAEGTPRLVLDWLTVKEYEHEVVFLVPHGELRAAFESAGVWQYYNDRFPLKFINGPRIATLVRRICRERKPDVVISWPTGTSQWIHAGARLAGVSKLIVHAGNPPARSFLQRYLASYFSFWSGLVLGNKVIACSAYIRNEFLRIPLLSARQFHWVHNCFDATRFKPDESPRTENSAIMVATLERHKDHHTLLNAWKIIEDGGLNANLKIAGAGSLRETLERQANDLELKNVEFLGSRTDVPQLLQASKVFVLSTTTREGFGTVLIEALASGCIIVATDVPACREVLDRGRYGLLVNPRNAGKLAAAIRTALGITLTARDKEERDAYVLNFSPENMIKKYLEIVG